METLVKFRDRLNEALLLRGMSPVELHRRTGISESTISQYRSGYAEPKKKKLQIIAEALDVNPTWLMGFDVPIIPEKRAAKMPPKKENDIADAYEKADEKTKRAIRIMLGLE